MLNQAKEIPGGSVDPPDETILHGVAREVMEETGLETARIVRKVGEFGWEERHGKWIKLVFEVEVKDPKAMKVVLEPKEHQSYLFATGEEVANDKAGDVTLSWITAPHKAMNLDAFKLRRDAS